ncbi:MOSC domain-containing protein [Pseudolysobacter antarcticus]|uniref:MOSC domain-containing protein n=1 Tax=Pseudolysobacter antarcticus TaxID=2511995 RepID=A0A411HGC3_9GAMM|nr:MOSC domain-containing protein [Pseudolysobacter antarcticus]QBB69501.1 MOSC domain-containing protein [Pseudolysobacter antarcticus]
MSTTLASLHIYPIKSCAQLTLASAVVEKRGLAHDRRWMIVDENARFITGRELARMTLLQAEPVATGLILRAPQMAPLHVSFPPANAPRLDVTVWKNIVAAQLADASANVWLSTFLGRPCRLVFMDDDCARVVTEHARAGDEVSFADAYPLLLISQAALDGLNARLVRPVGMWQFRPNLVVAGCEAHAEDRWSRIRIGEIEFDVVKSCTRCVFTTVDPARGELSPDGEPLRTLIGYRRTPAGVTFGQNLIARGQGVIRAGDAIEVLEHLL